MRVIVGRKPVLEALKMGKLVTKVNILSEQKGEIISEIFREAAKNNILIEECDRRSFELKKTELLKASEVDIAQGVIAILEDLKFYGIKDLIIYSKKNNNLILALDTIQDPQNLGAVLRTAECCGVDGVILTRHNSAPITPTVVKTSAGATAHLKIVEVGNLTNTLKDLKDAGFWVVGSVIKPNKYKSKIDYNLPLCLIMGNEEKGIRRLVADNCDFTLSIPMFGKIDSLNISASAAVLMYHILNKRGKLID